MCKFIILISLIVFKQGSAHSSVLVKSKMWPQNSQINIVFLDGTVIQKQFVKRFAVLWIKKSSLSFNFFDSFEEAPTKTHIRVSFKLDTGSMLGAHGDYLSKEPTLRLNQLNQDNLSISRIKRLVLHEFGHALGFEHEYRNPKWPYGIAAIQQHIQTCEPRMHKLGYLLAIAKQKCREVNSPLTPTDVNATIYDENSIMNYPLEFELPNNQIKNIKVKSELSVLDKLAIQYWYANKSTHYETKSL